MKWFYIIVLFCLAQLAYAQKNNGNNNIATTVFTLNLGVPNKDALQNSDGKKRLVLPARNPVSFKLIGGNPYKYTYTINHDLIDFFTGQSYNPFDSLAKYVPVATAVKEDIISSTNREEPEALAKLKKDTAALSNKINELQRNGLKNKSSASEIAKMKRQLEKDRLLIKEFNKLLYQPLPPKESYVPQALQSIQLIQNMGSEATLAGITSLEPSSKANEEHNVQNAFALLAILTNKLKTDIDEYIGEISAEDYLDMEFFKVKRKLLNERNLELLSYYQRIRAEGLLLKDKAETYDRISKDISGTATLIAKDIGKMYQLKLDNYLAPVDINGKNKDAVLVSVERYNRITGVPDAKKNEYTIWIKGGVKIDVSAGAFITSLFDRAYETSDIMVNNNGTNETQKLIFSKDKGKYDVGFGSLINISLRGGSWLRPTLNAGVLFTTDQKFQILAGGGIIMGKEERVILHAGLTMGSVERISGQYKADGNTPYNLGTSGAVPVDNRFSFGHFFGLTYNFGKIKKAGENTK